jgi:hypothetical protein
MLEMGFLPIPQRFPTTSRIGVDVSLDRLQLPSLYDEG